jgi:hypothetical protein
MANIPDELKMYTTIKNVPSFMVEDAIRWHNDVSGDNWTVEEGWEAHADIQHRIGLLISWCDEYDVVNGKVVEINTEE